jgi:hypothetical protein
MGVAVFLAGNCEIVGAVSSLLSRRRYARFRVTCLVLLGAAWWRPEGA